MRKQAQEAKGRRAHFDTHKVSSTTNDEMIACMGSLSHTLCSTNLKGYADEGRSGEPDSVVGQESEVERDLLPEIVSNVIEWLVPRETVPFHPLCCKFLQLLLIVQRKIAQHGFQSGNKK